VSVVDGVAPAHSAPGGTPVIVSPNQPRVVVPPIAMPPAGGPTPAGTPLVAAPLAAPYYAPPGAAPVVVAPVQPATTLVPPGPAVQPQTLHTGSMQTISASQHAPAPQIIAPPQYQQQLAMAPPPAAVTQPGTPESAETATTATPPGSPANLVTSTSQITFASAPSTPAVVAAQPAAQPLLGPGAAADSDDDSDVSFHADEDDTEDKNPSSASVNFSPVTPVRPGKKAAASPAPKKAAEGKRPATASGRSASASRRRVLSVKAAAPSPGSKQQFEQVGATPTHDAPSSLRDNPSSTDEGEGSHRHRRSHGRTDPAPVDKAAIADKFSRLMCPQQYAGKVARITNVRPVEEASAAHDGKRVLAAYAIGSADEADFVAEHGFGRSAAAASKHFSSQLQLNPSHSHTDERGRRVSTYALCEIHAQQMRFATSEADANEQLDRADSCFITAQSALVVRSLAQVAVVALVDVVWVLFGDEVQPTCKAHKAPLQLYDPERREMICALCSASNPRRNKCVVLDDLFTPATVASYAADLRQKLHEIDGSLPRCTEHHSSIATAAARKRAAMTLQFQLVERALQAKRDEMLAVLGDEERKQSLAVAREILAQNEMRRHIAASLGHLESYQAPAETGAGPRPLAQLATVASAMSVVKRPLAADVGSGANAAKINLAFDAFRINLEGAVRAVTDAAILTPATQQQQQQQVAQQLSLRPGNMTSLQRANAALSPPRRAASPARGGGKGRTVNAPMGMTPQPQQRARSALGRLGMGQFTGASARRLASPQRQRTSYRSPPRRQNTWPEAAVGPANVLANGTCVFNFDLSSLLTKLGIIEWKIRVDDPGDWIGLGVGVGDIAAWTSKASDCDMRHLWIAPSNAPRTMKVRVAIASHGQAKLTVHDVVGQQLDDNRVAHWQPGRAAFPQVTFGRRAGQVTMLEAPRFIPFGCAK
jgi:hypothetical protein